MPKDKEKPEIEPKKPESEPKKEEIEAIKEKVEKTVENAPKGAINIIGDIPKPEEGASLAEWKAWGVDVNTKLDELLKRTAPKEEAPKKEKFLGIDLDC